MPRDNLLRVKSDVDSEIGYLYLQGELIAESRFDPERILREWLEGDVSHVVISCRGLTYIDSAGLSTLLGALHRFRRKNGDLILTEMNASLNAIFEITSMHKYFKIFPTLDEAKHHFDQLVAQRKKNNQHADQKKGDG